MVAINDLSDSVVFLHQGFLIGNGKKWHLYERCPMEDLPGRRFGHQRHLDIVDEWIAKSLVCTACFRKYVRANIARG